MDHHHHLYREEQQPLDAAERAVEAFAEEWVRGAVAALPTLGVGSEYRTDFGRLFRMALVTLRNAHAYPISVRWVEEATAHQIAQQHRELHAPLCDLFTFAVAPYAPFNFERALQVGRAG